MTNIHQASALAANQAAQTIPFPNAHKDNATYIRYLTIKDIEGPRDEVASVLDRITSGIARKKAEDQKKIRDAARMVLANLVHCIYQRKWLALPTKPELFNKGGYLHDQLYLTHRPTMAVLAGC